MPPPSLRSPPRRIFLELGSGQRICDFLTLKISWGSGKAAGAKPPYTCNNRVSRVSKYRSAPAKGSTPSPKTART